MIKHGLTRDHSITAEDDGGGGKSLELSDGIEKDGSLRQSWLSLFSMAIRSESGASPKERSLVDMQAISDPGEIKIDIVDIHGYWKCQIEYNFGIYERRLLSQLPYLCFHINQCL